MLKNKKCRIEWSPAALQDLELIAVYISSRGYPGNARHVVSKILKTAGQLHKSPRAGRIPPELRELSLAQYREIVCKPYRILYRTTEKIIYVLAVLDGRRDLSEWLVLRTLQS